MFATFALNEANFWTLHQTIVRSIWLHDSNHSETMADMQLACKIWVISFGDDIEVMMADEIKVPNVQSASLEMGARCYHVLSSCSQIWCKNSIIIQIGKAWKAGVRGQCSGVTQAQKDHKPMHFILHKNKAHPKKSSTRDRRTAWGLKRP